MTHLIFLCLFLPFTFCFAQKGPTSPPPRDYPKGANGPDQPPGYK